MKKVIIIGAGPSGLMAAGQAALNGADVTLLEKMHQPAIKLNITGSGRCNITNALPISDFEKKIRVNFRFLKHALYSFSNKDLIAFFEQFGVQFTTENNGKIFPVSQRAKDISQALINWVKNNGVKLITGANIQSVSVKNNEFVCLDSSKAEYKSNALIIATGGLSYPKTGATGDGYRLAKTLGHNIVKVRAALVPLEIHENISPLQGLSLSDVNLSIWIDGKKTIDKTGDMIFTHFGLSGPVILSLSCAVVDALDAQSQVTLMLDLFPSLNESELDHQLIHEFSKNAKQQLKNILKTMLPKRIIATCLKEAKIDPEKTASNINTKERKNLRITLKNLRFTVKKAHPITAATISAGGVNVAEINPKTMASKLVKGLYFAGELLDVDADTGGYNLQIAFSTGYLAGRNAL